MRRINTILPILVLAIAGVGCASNTERHWGKSVRANTEAQVANPVAALRNAEKDVGALDGNSAANANDRLRKHESGKDAGSTTPDIIQIGTGN
jgi:type IV pilus biogenesis protein CpaD/CtpE